VGNKKNNLDDFIESEFSKIKKGGDPAGADQDPGYGASAQPEDDGGIYS
jgi:hypothetical protein